METTDTCKKTFHWYFEYSFDVLLLQAYLSLYRLITLLLKYLYHHGQKGKSTTMQNKNKLFSLCMVNCSLASLILLFDL